MNVPADDTCPINLHYPDASPNALDLATIVRDGRRIRRRRIATVALGSTAALAVAATAALTMPHLLAHRGNVQTAAIYKSGVLKSFPPVSQVVVLGTYADARPQNWSAVAWISQNGEFCHGAADMSPRASDVSPIVSCATAPRELSTGGPTALVAGWPVFQSAPSKAGEFLAIGVLRGSATKVEITANGRTVDATVIALATPTADVAGAYAVWLPAEPDGSIHASDITRIRALDGSGNVVAEIP